MASRRTDCSPTNRRCVPLIVSEVGGDQWRRHLRADRAGRIVVAARHRHHHHPRRTGQQAWRSSRPNPVGIRRRQTCAAAASYFNEKSAYNRAARLLVSGRHDRFIDLPIRALRAQPSGEHCLAGRSPERDRTLTARLREFNATPAGERDAESPEAVARLRALGYVAGQAAVKDRYTDADNPKHLVDFDSAIQRAVEAFAAHRSDEAVQIYRDVVSRRPDLAIAYRHLAFIEWQRGNPRGAVEVLERALAARVTQPAVVAQLGGYLAEIDRVPEAIRLLEPLSKSPDADPDTLNSLGIAYVRAGRRDDAQRVFERVLTINPDSSVPLENLGLLALERGDVATARRQFELAIRADPRSSRAHADLGVAALRSGDRATAIAEWTRAAELDPRNADALYNLGMTLAGDGQLAAARPYLEQFMRVAPPAFYEKDLRDVAALLNK